MDKFVIEMQEGDDLIPFEIIDYAHDDNNRCKFEVFRDNRFIASFEPDSHGFLHVCRNSGTVNEEMLELLAERIERYNF